MLLRVFPGGNAWEIIQNCYPVDTILGIPRSLIQWRSSSAMTVPGWRRITTGIGVSPHFSLGRQTFAA